MACCDSSWKKWLYILAIIALVASVLGKSVAMVILAVLLSLAAYLIKSAPVVEEMPKGKKSKTKRKR